MPASAASSRQRKAVADRRLRLLTLLRQTVKISSDLSLKASYMTPSTLENRKLRFGWLVFILFTAACSQPFEEEKIRIGGNSPTGFYAGATAVSITPVIVDTFEDFDYSADETGSVGHIGPDGWFNGTLQNPKGKPAMGIEGFVDGDRNGLFEPVWLAGSHQRRPANDVHDELWARAVVMRSGETTLAIVALDAIGYFNDEVRKIRAAVQAQVELDHIIVTATHSHSAPDLIGIWGPEEGVPGYHPYSVAFVREQAVWAVVEAAKAASVSALYVASGSAVSAESLQVVGNMHHDLRDPVVIDASLGVLQFRAPSGATTQVIATLVNWSGHPEHMIDGNSISSDYPHSLRSSLEKAYPQSIAIFVNGVLGGQIGTNDAEVIRGERVFDGAANVKCRNEGHAYQIRLLQRSGACPSNFTVGDKNWMWEKAEAVGLNLADRVIELLESADQVATPRIDVFSQDVYLPVENLGYKLMFMVGGFWERLLFEDAAGELRGDLANYKIEDTWYVRTDVQRVDILGGDGVLAQLLTIPGEMHPELAVGGWDGSKTGLKQPFVHPDNPNPPFPLNPDGTWDTSGAPKGPYLRDKMAGKHTFLFGLANDELGYIVPAFNWELAAQNPYLEQAPGDHYEETNSLGPDTADLLLSVYDELLAR